MSELKRGALPYKHDNRHLKLSNYIAAPFLTHPAKWDWAQNVKSWPMMKNDEIGDCVIASAGHMIMSFTAANGNLFIPSDQDIVSTYSAITGYDPSRTDGEGNNPTDNGTTLADALKYWNNTGIAGHKIGAYAQIDIRDINALNAAIYWFGGVFSAIQVDKFMEDQFKGESAWTIPRGMDFEANDQVLGGHGVPLLGFQPHWLNLITWAKDQRGTDNWWWGLGLEAWCVISEDFVTDQKPAPNGFDMQALVADLAKVKAA